MMTMVVHLTGQMRVMKRCEEKLNIKTWNDSIEKVTSMYF
jgi:hypothetical protein